MIFKLNLKMFDGAGGASSGTGDGTGTATSGANEGTSSGANNSKDLSKVVYGKQPTVAEDTSSNTQDDAQSRFNKHWHIFSSTCRVWICKQGNSSQPP